MAKSRDKMPHSKCENCEPCYYIDEAKGRLVPGFYCIIEEWDEWTSCTRHGCRYYRRSRTDYVILDDPQRKQKGANHEK